MAEFQPDLELTKFQIKKKQFIRILCYYKFVKWHEVLSRMLSNARSGGVPNQNMRYFLKTYTDHSSILLFRFRSADP
jgi:hypothetical protein